MLLALVAMTTSMTIRNRNDHEEYDDEGRKPVISEGTANSQEQEDAEENDDEEGMVISDGTENTLEDTEENDDEKGNMISAITDMISAISVSDFNSLDKTIRASDNVNILKRQIFNSLI